MDGSVRCELDHLIVVAPSLEMGSTYLERILGIAPQKGGEHARMGTHNMLLRLGDSAYLEVLAINPEAPKPDRPRWFELETVGSPRLATWVARTDDIHATSSRSPVPLGNIESMSRGDLEWLITIPEDRKMRLGGIAPSLIEWRRGGHPASRLKDSGCSLVRLRAFQPEPDRARALLDAIGFEGPLTISSGPSPKLVAEIETPSGIRELD